MSRIDDNDYLDREDDEYAKAPRGRHSLNRDSNRNSSSSERISDKLRSRASDDIRARRSASVKRGQGIAERLQSILPEPKPKPADDEDGSTSGGFNPFARFSAEEPEEPSAADYDASRYAGAKSRTMRAEQRKKIGIIALIVLLVIIIVPGTAFAVSATFAKSDAQELVTQGKTLFKQMKNGDKEASQKTATALSETASKLNGNVGSPLWAGATLIPVIGDDVKQVRAIAGVVDILADDVLLPVVDALPADGLGGIISDGGIDVTIIQAMLEPLGKNADKIHEYAREFEGIGTPHIKQLEEPVEMMQEIFPILDDVSANATGLSQVLPDIMGVNGERTYLLMACNNAEIRSTGGMPGQLGLMTIKNGKINVGDFSGHTSNPTLPEGGGISVPEDELALFGQRVTRETRDVNFIPDFTRVGEIEKAIWERNGNTPVQGVIALDPVFLQRILALVGGVTASDGTTVDGRNAAEYLLNGIYKAHADSTATQDALFTEIAGLSLQKFFENIGKVDMTKFAQTLFASLDDRHFYVWMENPAEEQVMKDMGIAGTLSGTETEPELGVYVGSATGCKMFWYLDTDVTVANGRRNFDGSVSYEVMVEFKNTVSAAEAATLPGYITGNDPIGRGAGDMLLDIYIFAPMGGSIGDWEEVGAFVEDDYWNGNWNTMPGDLPMSQTTYNGYEVWYGMTQILPETDTTLTFTVTTSKKAEEPLKVDVTPMPNEANDNN